VKIDGSVAITMPGGTILTVDSTEKLDSDLWEMYGLLNGGDVYRTLDDWYNSPAVRLESLENLKQQYVYYAERLTSSVERSPYPIVREVASDIIEMRNANLAPYHLAGSFADYAGAIAAMSLVAVLFLICPVIATDRRLGVHLLAYSSKTGRKVFKFQFFAVLVVAVIVSALVTLLSWIPYFVNGAFEYWNAPIMSYGVGRYGILLYDITFGQYALLLGCLSVLLAVAAACAAFLLSRFSANSVAALIKAVPTGAALVVLCMVITMWFGFEENKIFHILNSWFNSK
jgi:hypothetical protein